MNADLAFAMELEAKGLIRGVRWTVASRRALRAAGDPGWQEFEIRSERGEHCVLALAADGWFACLPASAAPQEDGDAGIRLAGKGIAASARGTAEVVAGNRPAPEDPAGDAVRWLAYRDGRTMLLRWQEAGRTQWMAVVPLLPGTVTGWFGYVPEPRRPDAPPRSVREAASAEIAGLLRNVPALRPEAPLAPTRVLSTPFAVALEDDAVPARNTLDAVAPPAAMRWRWTPVAVVLVLACAIGAPGQRVLALVAAGGLVLWKLLSWFLRPDPLPAVPPPLPAVPPMRGDRYLEAAPGPVLEQAYLRLKETNQYAAGVQTAYYISAIVAVLLLILVLFTGDAVLWFGFLLIAGGIGFVARGMLHQRLNEDTLPEVIAALAPGVRYRARSSLGAADLRFAGVLADGESWRVASELRGAARGIPWAVHEASTWRVRRLPSSGTYTEEARFTGTIVEVTGVGGVQAEDASSGLRQAFGNEARLAGSADRWLVALPGAIDRFALEPQQLDAPELGGWMTVVSDMVGVAERVVDLLLAHAGPITPASTSRSHPHPPAPRA